MKANGIGTTSKRADGRVWARAPNRQCTSLGVYTTQELADNAVESWGRVWTLQEVCSMLRHSSITVTRRYAHLGDSLKRAAREQAALQKSRLRAELAGQKFEDFGPKLRAVLEALWNLVR